MRSIRILRRHLRKEGDEGKDEVKTPSATLMSAYLSQIGSEDSATAFPSSRGCDNKTMSDHNSPADPHHRCDSPRYSNITTAVLEHTDEVWNIRWSHDGEYLAGAERRESAIIWAVGVGYYLLPSRLSADSEILLARERAGPMGMDATACSASPTPRGVCSVISR